MDEWLQPSLPPAAPWKYVERAGCWAIDIGLPSDPSPEGLTHFAYDMVRSFMTAFHTLCRVTTVGYDTVALDAGGRVVQIREGETLKVRTASVDVVVKHLEGALGKEDGSFFSKILLDCDVRVIPPETGRGLPSEVWIPGAGWFYLGYVLEYDSSDRPVPTEGSIEFQTAIDVWLDRTLDLNSRQWRDNLAYAQRNRRRLADALRAWEKLVGHPISEWSSRYYPDQTSRYGFTSQLTSTSSSASPVASSH